MSGTGARLRVRLTPRGGSSRIDGVLDGVLRVRVSAPPVDGAANEALLRLLADELGVPRRDVSLVSGAGSRTKVVEVGGLTAERVRARWPGVEA